MPQHIENLDMPDAQLAAHSLAEAKLYFLATPCPTCRRGPVVSTGAGPIRTEHELRIVDVTARCEACGTSTQRAFSLGAESNSERFDDSAINPTDQPSQIVDVVQWVALSHTLQEAASRAPDVAQARRLKIEAGCCLEEALKFFDDPDNDLPPQTALLCDASRVSFRNNPQQFSRQRLINVLAKLPKYKGNSE